MNWSVGKTIALVFAVMLLSTVFVASFSVQADALTKGSGSKRPETNSKKVCGDKLCAEVFLPNVTSAFPQSRFQVGGVTQQAFEMDTSTADSILSILQTCQNEFENLRTTDAPTLNFTSTAQKCINQIENIKQQSSIGEK